jgi:hypothetical protein
MDRRYERSRAEGMPCVLSCAILLGFGIRLIPVRILATSGEMPSVRAPHLFNGSFSAYGSVSVMPKTTIKTDITPEGLDLEATQSATTYVRDNHADADQ